MAKNNWNGSWNNDERNWRPNPNQNSDRESMSGERDYRSLGDDDRKSDYRSEWRSYDRNEDRNSMMDRSQSYDRGQNFDRDRTYDLNRNYERNNDRTGNFDKKNSANDSWGFARDNRVGSSSYDWGSKEYGNRDLNDRNFGREWDKGSSLTPGQNDYVARSVGLETGRNHVGRGPKGYRRSDDRIKEDIGDVLEKHPDIDASEIEFEVKEGIVVLRGHVEDRQTKRMAEDVIEHINGVKDIRNELAVNKSLFERAKEFFTGDHASTPDREATRPRSDKSRH